MSRCRVFTNGVWGPVQCPTTTYVATQGDCSGCCMNHCPYGREVHTTLIGLHVHNKLSTNTYDREYMEALNKWCDHGSSEHGMPVRNESKTHTGNGTYQGAFAFTLTKSPEDSLTEADMIKAVQKVMNQKSIPTAKFAWYLEYGDEELRTHPHIHGMYETETGGMIETKHWKRAWPIWNPKQKLGKGFRGGYHRPVRDNECYDDYIRKQDIKGERYNC